MSPAHELARLIATASPSKLLIAEAIICAFVADSTATTLIQSHPRDELAQIIERVDAVRACHPELSAELGMVIDFLQANIH